MTNTVGFSTRYSLSDVSDGDGTATTLLFGEKAAVKTKASGIIHPQMWDYQVMVYIHHRFMVLELTMPVSSVILNGYPSFGLPAVAASLP